jgi:hypothetical protein
MTNPCNPNKDPYVNQWDSDSSSSDTGADLPRCDKFPDGNVMLGKNVPLIKDDNEGVLRTDSFREYIERVEDFEDLRSMFICMILDFKERIKGCEQCETCSQVIELVELNIRMCKKVSKLAHSFATIFMHIVNNIIPTKLSHNAQNHLNVVFILLIKNSKFPDVQFIRDKFKPFINVDAFEGLALRLAIQKYRPADIRTMLLDWGCDSTVRNHRPIIRAFYYEKFGVVRTLIESGSSYKYYLQEELPITQYEKFQKDIDKYLAREMPDATPMEQEFRIVEMINDFRHLLLVDGDQNRDTDDSDEDYNPMASSFFLEHFMEHFYETTGISQSVAKKRKKKNKKKKKQATTDPTLVEEIQTTKEDMLDTTDANDSMNNETFNPEPEPEPEPELMETVVLDSYFTDMITMQLPMNQIHLANWIPFYNLVDTSYPAYPAYPANPANYWDTHFHSVFTQYAT